MERNKWKEVSSRNIGILSLIGLLLISCSGDRSESRLGSNEYESGTYTHDLIKTGELRLPIDSLTSFESNNYTYYSTANKEFLVTSSFEKNSIQIFSIDNSSIIKEILLARDGPNGFKQMRGFVFVNFDSIFVFDSFTLRNTILIDSSGRIINKYDIHDENDHIINHASMTRLPTIFNKGKLYFFKFPNYDFTHPSFFEKKIPFELEYDIGKNIIRYKDIYWPESFYGRPWGYLSLPSRTLGQEGNFIYSFCIEDNLIVTNFEDASRVQLAKSQFVNERSKPRDEYSNDNEHFLEEYTYEVIIYDKYREVSYRTVGLKTQYRNSSGKINPLQLKPFSIIVLDKNFTKIAETVIKPIEEYNPRDIFVGKRGLYVSGQNLYNPNLEEDSLVFNILELKEIKSN
jgi:hypothetical protein